MQNKLKLTICYASIFFIINGLSACGSSDKSTPVDDVVNNSQASSIIHGLADYAAGYPVGAALPAGDASNSVLGRKDLQEIVVQHFSQITAENIMKPEYLQPSEGEFFYTDADNLIDFAEDNGMSVHGHTLVWHKRLPEFMDNCSGEVECSGYLTDHITNIVGNYKGRITSWDVVNEAFTDDFGVDSTYRNIDTSQINGVYGSVWYREIGKDYIPLAFITAHKADPNAELYYNDYNLEDNNTKLTSVLSMVNELIKDEVPIHGIGFQMHVSLTEPAIEDIRAALILATKTGLKIKLTEIDIRTNTNGNYNSYNSEVAELLNARYQSIVSTYLAVVPEGQIGGISFWGVSDADSWIPDYYNKPDWPLLFDDELNPKDAIIGVASAMSDGQL